MKRLYFSLLIVFALFSSSQAQSTFQVNPGQTITTTNNGLITAPPVIDAVNFINYGTMLISTIFSSVDVPETDGNFSFLLTPKPFETFNTLNFTNYGTMSSVNGWRFSLNSNATGNRHMASSFVNQNGGFIEAVDPFSLFYYNGYCAVSAVDPSYLLVWATNIISGGGIASDGSSLKVGLNGLLDLVGHDVNLAHSGLEVTPVWTQPQGTAADVDGTIFLPDISYYDLAWAQSAFNDDYVLNSRAIWDGFSANAQFIPLAQGGLPAGIPGFSIPFPAADSYVNARDVAFITVTNIIGDPTNVIDIVIETVTLNSNLVKGATFVGVPPGFAVDFGYVPSSIFNNQFNDAEVLLTTTITNVVTGDVDLAGFYIRDELATSALRGNALNSLYCSSPQTFRPAPYWVDRLLFNIGGTGNFGYPDADFFFNTGDFDPNILFNSATNRFHDQGEFAGYAVYSDNLASRPPAVPNGTVTNLPGRVHISAENLNLDHTIIRGEGRIQIDTPHLISSTNAVIDCEHLSFNLGSKTERLHVQSLVPPNETVSRLKGTVQAWSAVWSNEVTVVLQNWAVSNVVVTNIVGNVTNTVTNLVATLAPITNTLGVGYHVFMVDARGLFTAAPVYVFDLKTRGDHVVIDDPMTLVENLLIDGRSLTLNNKFALAGFYPPNPLTGFVPPVPYLNDWRGVHAPNLLHLTNNGSFLIPNQGHFGDDRPPYANFVNSGFLSAFGLTVNSDYFQNSGSITTSAGIFLHGRSGRFEDGSATATTFSQFSFRELKWNNYTHDGGTGPVVFYVTNSLSDAGPGSGNTLRVRDGFRLLIKPAVGDLLGTSVETIASPRPSITHLWAGEDRGPTPAGFSNNVALGRLALIPGSGGSKFVFSGTGSRNGLYVDVLDLTAFGSEAALTQQIQINPNLVIYYAAADLGFTPPDVDGVAQQPEEYLNGRFNGRLRWVPTFAGPNSGVPLVVNGQPTSVNQAFLNSLLIDSDDDGVPNGQDLGPDVIATAPVTVEVFGNGVVSPNYNGADLVLGGVYSMTATPAKGAVFTGWSGSIESTSPTILFTNTGDIFLAADFEFQVTPGTYSGLFYETDGVQMGRSGYITLRASKNGAFSGTVQMGADRFGFSGGVDGDGNAFPGAPLLMELHFDADRVTGTIGDGEWTAELQADLAATNSPAAGRYTIAFRGGNITNTAVPIGDGYGTVTVSRSGRVKLKGVLADGSKVSQSTTFSQEGNWPLYASLYDGAGQILGWMSFQETAEQDVGGDFSWIREMDEEAIFYPDGFNFTGRAMGSRVMNQRPITGFTEGTFVLEGGNLPSDILRDFLVSTNGNKVTVIGTNKTTLTFSSQGTFKGALPNPLGGSKPLNFNGVLLQKQNMGAGFFLGTNQSGRVSINPSSSSGF